MIANHTEFHPHCRELVYSGFSADKAVMSLRIPELKQQPGDAGYMNIPLYSATLAEDKQAVDIELVHLYPLIYDFPEKELHQISRLPAGFFYVFVDGFLWRELEVVDGGDQIGFKEVNLGKYGGNQAWREAGFQRPSSGEAQQTILVPHRLGGEQVRVEVGYSETQWCWDQILKLGGMNLLDPRLNEGRAISAGEFMTPDEAEAVEFRSKRLLHLDNLGDYEQGFTEVGTVRAGTPYQSQGIIEHPAAAELAVVVLTNGLHMMRRMAAAISVYQSAIALHLKELQGIDVNNPEQVDDQARDRYELACFMMETFYYKTDALVEGEVELDVEGDDGKARKAALEFAQKMKSWRIEKLDEQAFFDYLGYDEMMLYAHETATMREHLIAYLEDVESAGNFALCVEDYGYYRDIHFNSLGEVFEVLARVLKNHPAHQFAHLIREQSDWYALAETDGGQDFLLRCLDQHPEKACHPIHDILFPHSEGQALHQYRQTAESRFSPRFYPHKVQAILASEEQLEPAAITQLGRRFSHMLMGLSVNLYELPQTSFQLSHQGNVSIRQATVDNQRQLKRATDNLHAARAKKLELTQQLAQAKQSYKEKKSAYHQALASIGNRHGGPYAAELEKMRQGIVEQQRETSRFQHQLERAVRQIEIAQQGIQRLGKVTASTGGKAFAVFDGARTHAYLSILRLADIAEPGKLVEMEMLADDYLNGRFPEGYTALDPAMHKRLAEQRLKELRLLRRKDKRRLVDVKIPGLGTQKVPLEDLFSLNSRLEQLIKLLREAGQGQQQASTELIRVYLVKSEVVMSEATGKSASVTALNFQKEQSTSNELETSLNKIANDIEHHQLAVEHFVRQEKELSALAAKPIPKSLDVNNMRAGLFGVLGAVAVLEVVNLKQAVGSLDNSSLRTYVDIISAIFDCAAISFSISVAVLDTFSPVFGLKELDTYQRELKKGRAVNAGKLPAKFQFKAQMLTGVARLNLLANFVTLGLASYDCYWAHKRGDKGATVGLGIAALASLGGILETIPLWLATLGRGIIIRSFGYLGIYSLLLSVGGVGIYYFLADEPMQTWLGTCPWGKYAYGSHESTAWQNKPQLAYFALMELLFVPRTEATITPLQVHHAVRNNHSIDNSSTATFKLAASSFRSMQNNLLIEFDYKDIAQEDIHYRSLLMFGEQKYNHDELDFCADVEYFWRHCEITLNSDLSGFSMIFESKALKRVMLKLPTEQVNLRLRSRLMVNSNDKKLPPRQIAFSLPQVKEHDSDGWSNSSLNIGFDDYLVV